MADQHQDCAGTAWCIEEETHDPACPARPTEVRWELTKDRLAALRSGDIRRLVKWARRELRSRWLERKARDEAMQALSTGLGNVMACVT